MTWVDATFQGILTARVLAQAAVLLGRPEDETEELRIEVLQLSGWVNEYLWCNKRHLYVDRRADGSLSPVNHIGCFWGLLSGAVPPSRVEAFADNLSDPRTFNRHHRVPSLSASDEGYDPEAEAWSGGVWPPTCYMVLRGLTNVGKDDLAFTIALNHHQRVVEVFEKTRTFWSSYAPEFSLPGVDAKPDFVGWSGLSPITVLLEYVFGIRPRDPLGNRFFWDIHLTDGFGVERYPIGPSNEVSIFCERRSSPIDEPQITITAKEPTLVDIHWPGGSKTIRS
jgi:glycogen debranching enzyme